MVRLALTTQHSLDGLLDGLQRAASIYRDRAADWVRSVAIFLPVGFTLLVGGIVVSSYALLLFHPYITMLESLSQ